MAARMADGPLAVNGPESPAREAVDNGHRLFRSGMVRVRKEAMKRILASLLLALTLALPAPAGAQATEIVQDYEPDPAIWLLEDDDTKIYLLGTVHALPAGFRWRSARLDEIVEQADELIVESSEEDMRRDDAAMGEVIGELAKRPRVSERLSPENGWKWLALGESLGLPAEYFDRLPPLLALFGIGTSFGREETGSEADHGVESVLEADFRTAGKPIASIEDGNAVLRSLLAINEAVLIKELDRELSRWNGASPAAMFVGAPAKRVAGQDDSLLAQEHAWAQGEEVDVRDQMFGPAGFGPAMGKILLDNRNRAWAAWLENRLAEPGTLLVAVGAAHLAGHNSVHAMLTKRGLTSKRLN